ncbi:glycosyltransferase [Sphingobacterium bovistauri]|uniref:Glycosyltransferase n=1 Tax=Sphingobacterium bovistauri TaxID=2781959 RepID=A0ABS7Z8J4_9SPHI|nr:glycosyltransferase [Sphingobacterium bovistauri]MCA5006516.1 glycosyltransferase [Sphingobacterium bovistauri]
MVKTSLIISVYKNTEFLNAVLDSLNHQTIMPNEIIISEDGNDENMYNFINNYPFLAPHVHLTQDDIGWRKNQALNNAIRSSKYEYLIFIDGDCVLHPKFIENHIKMASPKDILAGKRVKLGVQYSDILINSTVKSFSNDYLKNYKSIKNEGGAFCEEGIIFPLNFTTKAIIKALGISSIKGCNFSCFKSSLLSINGFDEDYTKPAIGEDIDLVWRFKGLGYNITSIKHFAIQYHLYHKESWTDQSENEKLMQNKMNAKTFRCINGLQK